MMAVSLLKEFAGETRAANTCQDQRLGVAPRARGRLHRLGAFDVAKIWARGLRKAVR